MIIQGPRSKFSSGRGGGGGGLERQTSKDESTGGSGECREMHSKLINEILKLSVLKKRYRLTKWYSPLKN